MKNLLFGLGILSIFLCLYSCGDDFKGIDNSIELEYDGSRDTIPAEGQMVILPLSDIDIKTIVWDDIFFAIYYRDGFEWNKKYSAESFSEHNYTLNNVEFTISEDYKTISLLVGPNTTSDYRSIVVHTPGVSINGQRYGGFIGCQIYQAPAVTEE